MDISISHYTAIGKRKTNEDSHAILESEVSLLAIVADGLGGLTAGEIASRQAITTLHSLLLNKAPDEELLVDAIRQAGSDIHQLQTGGQLMCTTVSVIWMGNNGVLAANVGDTRIYQFRDGRIIYQTVDHSVAQMSVFVGELEQSQVRTSKDRNTLTRVLGDARPPRVDVCQLNVRAGDRFLICSDGFWEPVTEEAMLRTMLSAESVDRWLSQMRRIVEEAGNPKQDNHTAIAIAINQISNERSIP